MKPLRVVIALAALAAAAPSLAQPVYVPPAGSNQPGTSNVTARDVDAIKPPIPETGTANYRILTHDGKCLVPQIRDGKVYLIRPGGCIDGLTLNARFYGNQRARLEVDRSGTCLVFRHVEMDGSGLRYRSWGQGLSVAPCDESIEQRFRIDWLTPDTVSLRHASGTCWWAADTAIVQQPCDRNQQTHFRLSVVQPAGYVAPANPGGGTAYPGTTTGSTLGTATPVETAPPVVRIAPLPVGVGPTAPLPGPGEVTEPVIYALAPASAPEGTHCYLRIGGGAGYTPRVEPARCINGPEAEVTVLPVNDGTVALAMDAPARCFTTGDRPWITLDRCASVEQQLFTIQPTATRGQYRIKTRAGLCLTQRGNPNEDRAKNNSALFVEPCRDAPEQSFVFRPVRL